MPPPHDEAETQHLHWNSKHESILISLVFLLPVFHLRVSAYLSSSAIPNIPSCCSDACVDTTGTNNDIVPWCPLSRCIIACLMNVSHPCLGSRLGCDYHCHHWRKWRQGSFCSVLRLVPLLFWCWLWCPIVLHYCTMLTLTVYLCFSVSTFSSTHGFIPQIKNS